MAVPVADLRAHLHYSAWASARLVAAAGAYLTRLGREPPCRFDAILFDAPDQSRPTWERNILDV